MKNLKMMLLLAGMVLLTIFSACRFSCVKGSGHSVSETRKVADFTRIEVKGGYKITLKQDSSLSLSITADDNVLKDIHTEADAGQLIISSKKNMCLDKAIAITIGVRHLEALKASGATELLSDGKMTVKDLELQLSGASKVNLDLNANNVITSGSGVTEIYLKGQAASHTVNITGTGKIEALDFVVGKYDLETTGASNCKINVLTELNVHSTGASDVQYRGNPTSVNTSKTGASSVKKMD